MKKQTKQKKATSSKSRRTELPPLEQRRERLAEDILRFRENYPLAKLLAFFLWATEPDEGGRMQCELQKTWSTGGRLLRFSFNGTLPDNWQLIAPDFARIYNKVCAEAEEPSLFDNEANHSPTPSQYPAVSTKDLSVFRSMIAACRQAQRPAQQLAYFDAVRLYSRTQQAVTFAVPNRLVMEYIEKHLIGVLLEPFRTAFGNTTLLWQIVEPPDFTNLPPP